MGLLFSTWYHLWFQGVVLVYNLIQGSIVNGFKFWQDIIYNIKGLHLYISFSLSHKHIHDTNRERERERGDRDWSLLV